MAYIEANSFTTVARVEALCMGYDFTSGTKPTEQAVLDRMAQQAARVRAVLASVGHPGTVPTPVSGTASAITDSSLASLCDEANAFLAAAYAIPMRNVRSETDDKLSRLYLEAVYGQTEFGKQIGGLFNDIRDYVIAAGSGTTQRSAVSAPEYAIADLPHLADMDS